METEEKKRLSNREIEKQKRKRLRKSDIETERL